ncbi:hypothetical protein P175DRAFT_0500650 [Aspergillus ochraceoroseus IBT 24754]|uniref:Uncharacterized protein n=1 Tax=Aspergillus ochraceoroseus IBT 24754 TaxID=1392256 RepID=A0A2T5LZR5_9EURO|nr:uncharacterized protein P175DRAFT_0500650 [Aspergillus ochraceoroseus IBT 24754]PTU21773.1 hypothetical protein P175DRAFT_0500650 [Aspergillus ochraceoroseus IBT 24754]
MGCTHLTLNSQSSCWHNPRNEYIDRESTSRILPRFCYQHSGAETTISPETRRAWMNQSTIDLWLRDDFSVAETEF